jgi:hypothetical protein
LEDVHAPKLQVFAIWEPVLPTDFRAPSTSALNRLRDPRAAQFWDKDRLVSKAMGERDRQTIVWDRVVVYEPGKVWQDSPPEALFNGGTVVHVISNLEQTLKRFAR